jgi:hypothetical protein
MTGNKRKTEACLVGGVRDGKIRINRVVIGHDKKSVV